jgi:hypothetical protein
MDHFSPSLFAILNALDETGQKRRFSTTIKEELLLLWRDAPVEDRTKWLGRAHRFHMASRSPDAERLRKKLLVREDKL